MMIALTRLLQLFPFGGATAAVADRFNAMAQREMEGVRDFVILHYHLNARDEPFWRQCREMSIPDTLAARLALFAEEAQAYQGADELFRVSSWLQVMLGQGLTPHRHHLMARMMPPGQLAEALTNLSRGIAARVATLPPHQQFVDTLAGART
jgi:tryptophan halogenase